MPFRSYCNNLSLFQGFVNQQQLACLPASAQLSQHCRLDMVSQRLYSLYCIWCCGLAYRIPHCDLRYLMALSLNCTLRIILVPEMLQSLQQMLSKLFLPVHVTKCICFLLCLFPFFSSTLHFTSPLPLLSTSFFLLFVYFLLAICVLRFKYCVQTGQSIKDNIDTIIF